MTPYRTASLEARPSVPRRRECGLWGHLPYKRAIQVRFCLGWHCPHCLDHVGPPPVRLMDVPNAWFYVVSLCLGLFTIVTHVIALLTGH